jgi:hypothetical protein
VIANTKAQNVAERLIAHLVRQFPAAEALLLISFRFTRTGVPYLIEVHADLGGDAIAEVLWPAAQTQEDFFELAIMVAEGSQAPWTSPSWQPTALFYGPNGASGARDDTQVASGSGFLVQKGDLKENLSALENIVKTRQLSLRYWPEHLSWLEENRS